MTGNRYLAVLIVCWLSTFAADSQAETLQEIFEAGNNGFWNGEYEEAIKKYEKLESLNVRSSTLAYNLGTSYARIGKLGMAVFHYERALKLDPGHVDTLSNLSAIRDFLARQASQAGRDADLAPAVGPWRALLDRFSAKSAAYGFLFFHVSLFAMLVLRRFIRSEMPRLSIGVLIGILSILTLMTGAITVGKWHQEKYVSEAVVVTPGTLEVKEGPQSDVVRFALDEGSRVTIKEQRNGWIRFTDSGGRDGWAPGDRLRKI